MPPIDDRIGPVTLRFFAGQVFEEAMQTGKPTVDGRRVQPCGDLVIDEGVDVLRCYAFGRFVVDSVDENVQVADVVLQRAGLAKTTFEISLETRAGSVQDGLRYAELGSILAQF